MRPSAPILNVILWGSAIFLSFTNATETSRLLRVRGLAEFQSRIGKYRNPCTGSWSNELKAASAQDCESGSGGLSGGSGTSGGGSGSDRGDGFGGSDYDDCSIQHDDDPNSPTVQRPVEYWYCVESSSNNTKEWLPILEEKIFAIARDRLTWCIGYPVRRSLMVAEELTSRKLGVLAVTSQPTDTVRSDGTILSSTAISLTPCVRIYIYT